jgi:hypothetical protein
MTLYEFFRSVWPPRKSGRSKYQDALIRRAFANLDDNTVSETDTAATALDELAGALSGPADTESAKSVNEAATRLRSAENAAARIAAAHHASDVVGKLNERRGADGVLGAKLDAAIRMSDKVGLKQAEWASGYLGRVLDLQIGKAGGLLAFNAVVAAIAIALIERYGSMTVGFALATVTISSVVCLFAIAVHWRDPEFYRSAAKGLESAISLAAIRAQMLNTGVVAAIVAVLLIGIWFGFARTSSTERTGLTEADLAQLRSEIQKSFRLPESVRLSCDAIESPEQKGVERSKVACTITK